ncbi:MAG: TIGR03960 family B12-binding radical SAM protein [Treponema sp.]|nr:TIGR03960 family B12-binding radical SAM protein [Treponema sp.]
MNKEQIISDFNTLQYVDPVNDLGHLLLSVEKPARYVGGEVGCLAKIKELELQTAGSKKNDVFRTLIAFPDLYEIGMGNQALRIIYNYMNNLQGVICDRAFAPSPDFENLLREHKIPLYGLETGISLASVDLLMFTLGYELGLNGVLTMLDVSEIPVKCEDRRGKPYPIIIAGGPAVSNPLPFSPFIDAFWIGEAEDGFFDLAVSLAELRKKEGSESRVEMLNKIVSHPNVWTSGKQKALRAIYTGFSQNISPDAPEAVLSADLSPTLVYPIPGMKIVQNHGTVEIMRGCPNGCRFCHAGFWYRPARQKSIELIIKQVNDLVELGGWQQISLSSLSSGDFNGIEELIDNLNLKFSGKKVSFQLPSLKVSGFALSLLEKISETRKSGLTFAVETPQDAWQLSINKTVTRDSVVAILEEAKKRGWKTAKFYFMIGLRTEAENNLSEEAEIVSFIIDVARRSRMRFNINVGIFIPKPHTPYQWMPKIDSETAYRKLSFIHSNLKPLGHKVSTSDSLISRVESLLSRGDEKAGLLCEEAWRGGSRLDPWDEFIKKDVWSEILHKNSEYLKQIFSGQNTQLPWHQIDSCVKTNYLKQELEKSDKIQRTASCKEKCNACGVCDEKILKPINIQKHNTAAANAVNQPEPTVNKKDSGKADPSVWRMLFSFSKEGSAVFHGHLSLIEIFSMAFRRAGIPIMYTQGFNPLAKIEFASTLSTGIWSQNEAAAVDFNDKYDPQKFVTEMNKNLPDGISIKKAEIYLIKRGEKKHSLASLLWGFAYYDADNNIDYVSFKDEKIYRQNRLGKDCNSLFSLKRQEVLARNIMNKETEQISYFEAYNRLYLPLKRQI